MFSRVSPVLCRALLSRPSTSQLAWSSGRLFSLSAASFDKQVKVLSEEELKITPVAVERLKTVLERGERLRVEVDGGGCSGFEYKIKVDDSGKMNDDDSVLEREGVEVVVDELSLGYLRGATIDYVEDLMKASFRVTNNPVAEKGCSCGSSFAPKMD